MQKQRKLKPKEDPFLTETRAMLAKYVGGIFSGQTDPGAWMELKKRGVWVDTAEVGAMRTEMLGDWQKTNKRALDAESAGRLRSFRYAMTQIGQSEKRSAATKGMELEKGHALRKHEKNVRGLLEKRLEPGYSPYESLYSKYKQTEALGIANRILSQFTV